MSTSPRTTYDEGLAADELRFQTCAACAKVIFYPRVMCPGCGGTDLEWQRSAGHGAVYSTTTVSQRDGSYNVCLVDVDEGFRMLSTVLGEPVETRIGDRVSVAFTELSGELAPVFSKETTSHKEPAFHEEETR